MKSYTDLKQSKTLEKILPLESADMYYFVADSLEKQEINYAIRCGTPIVKTDIPCWGLVALLNVIPNYKLSSEHNYHTCAAETSFGKEQVVWYDNPIDACYAMIIKLHELKML